MLKYRTLIAATALAALSGGMALASDVSGVWMRADGKTKVKFAPCAAALCGFVVWNSEKDAPAHIGERVFYDMAPAGENHWQGSAYNPEDGKTYSGKLTLAGDSLATAGCVLGGLICKSFSWTRSN